MIVVNANGGDVDRAMALQDWFSVQENHDLVGLGIDGTDWKAVGDRSFERLSTYSFPSYAILWRAGLERLTSAMTDSEKKVFGWAQDSDNFELDTFASFIPDVTPGEGSRGADEQRHHPVRQPAVLRRRRRRRRSRQAEEGRWRRERDSNP